MISIIDSYLASQSVYDELERPSQKLICIDDTMRIEYPDGSTILNPGFGGLYLDYDETKYKVLTGPEYVLLRKPFREDFKVKEINAEVDSLLVTMGGTDFHGLTLYVLKILVNKYPNIQKHIILGLDFVNKPSIKKYADKNTNFYQGLDAQSMRDLMLTVDFAVSAAGQTSYELGRCGVPMILLQTADNQTHNATFWEDICTVVDAGERGKISNYLDNCQNQNYRSELRAKYPKFGCNYINLP